MAKPEIVKCSCPLCGTDSSYYELDFGERHYYKCPTCTKYIITETAEKRIRESGALNSTLSTCAAVATKDNALQVLEIQYSGYSSSEDNPVGIYSQIVNKSEYRL